MEKNHVSIDLETLGLIPGSVILTIGLVKFNPKAGVQSSEELRKDSLQIGINLAHSLKDGFIVDANTLTWWVGLPGEVREATFASCRGEKGLHPAAAAEEVRKFLSFDKDVKIWGNGVGFDNVLLQAVFNKYNLAKPWEFWNDRDLRTLKVIAKWDKSSIPANPMAHECLSDAIHQAQIVQAIQVSNPNLDLSK